MMLTAPVGTVSTYLLSTRGISENLRAGCCTTAHTRRGAWRSTYGVWASHLEAEDRSQGHPGHLRSCTESVVMWWKDAVNLPSSRTLTYLSGKPLVVTSSPFTTLLNPYGRIRTGRWISKKLRCPGIQSRLSGSRTIPPTAARTADLRKALRCISSLLPQTILRDRSSEAHLALTGFRHPDT